MKLPSLLSRLFSRCLREGYYFCTRCEHIARVGAGKAHCQRCKTDRWTVWQPAILTQGKS